MSDSWLLSRQMLTQIQVRSKLFNIDNNNCFPGQSRLENTEPFKSKLSKASQEVLQRRHLLLENEKKRGNMAVTMASDDTNSGENTKRSIPILGENQIIQYSNVDD